jgi:hypothetical protein
MMYYGQENAQLDRLNSTMPEDTIDCPGIVRTLANFILFGVPSHYHSKLHDLLAYDQVYVDRWQAFMIECISEWRGIFSWVCHESRRVDANSNTPVDIKAFSVLMSVLNLRLNDS